MRNCRLCALAAVVCERMGSMYCWCVSSFKTKSLLYYICRYVWTWWQILGTSTNLITVRKAEESTSTIFFTNGWAYAFGKCSDWINYAQVCSNAPLSPEYASRKLHLNFSISVLDASVNALFSGIFLMLVLFYESISIFSLCNEVYKLSSVPYSIVYYVKDVEIW